jgi:hypothetical protein
LKFWGVVILLSSVLLASCATDDPEADAFFHRGWLWPKSLDQPNAPPPPTEDAAARR